MHWTDKPNPEFEQWWATKTAAGYQYGREALENVRFGFEGAQSMRWQPIETAPKDGTEVLLGHGNSVWVDQWLEFGEDGACWMMCDQWSEPEVPSHWMPLPDPPSSTEVNNGR